MGVLDDARAHLAKADEFLDAARAELIAERCNVATSNAVTSGINAKDAICLALTGRTGKAERHDLAVGELRATGREGAALAPTLERLLRLKTRSQYQSDSVQRADAVSAVRWAERLVAAAHGVVGG